MQLVGLAVLAFIIWFGFSDRDATQISPFDAHALVMVLVGSAGAVLVSSSNGTALRTIALLRELVPGMRRFDKITSSMEAERGQICSLWAQGKRAAAIELGDKSSYGAIKGMVELLLHRTGEVASSKVFLELRQEELTQWQPAIGNWEMLAKLGPSFGMIGTITGMIQMFRTMSAENLNIGAAMSLALLATLYGVAFGAGVAGPIGHYLNGLLDERLGFLERCEKSVNEIVVRAMG